MNAVRFIQAPKDEWKFEQGKTCGKSKLSEVSIAMLNRSMRNSGELFPEIREQESRLSSLKLRASLNSK